MQQKILVTMAALPSFDEYVEEISSIWENKWLTNMGEKHQLFQKQLQEFLNVEQLELLVNGHMALELTLQAMELSGEVITTPFTFASTTHAIIRNGLTPVFCDINEDDYTIDVDKIESLITERTCAIMPVHVYGNICDVKRIQEIADKYNLKVIYDAAHAFGETCAGEAVGTFGDASIFSLHATKVFNSIEGGITCIHDTKLGEKIYSLKNFGIQDEESITGIGANAKMNEFQAAMGICNLRHFEENIKKRGCIVKRYQKNLEGIECIKVWKKQADVQSNYAYFPIFIDEQTCGTNRNDLYDQLVKENIFARKYFYPLTNSFECFKGVYDPAKTPVALKVSNGILCLPLYPELELDTVDYICDVIRKACR